jgi:hypothetical protein
LGYPGTDTHGLKSIETQWAKRLCNDCLTTDELFQTELVLLSWRLGEPIQELPIAVSETRPASLSIIRRFPKVMNMVLALRKSLRRFPKASPKKFSGSA